MDHTGADYAEANVTVGSECKQRGEFNPVLRAASKRCRI